MSKLSLAEIWDDHHATLVNAQTGHRRPADYVALYLPGAGAVAVLVALELTRPEGLALGAGAVSGMLAAAGLLSAFFFGLSVTLLDKAIDYDLSGPEVDDAVLERAERMQELAANTAFASLVAGVTTALLVVASTVDAVADIVTAVAAGGFVTVLTTGALVLRRIYNETKKRLVSVRTGDAHARANGSRLG